MSAVAFVVLWALVGVVWAFVIWRELVDCVAERRITPTTTRGRAHLSLTKTRHRSPFRAPTHDHGRGAA